MGYTHHWERDCELEGEVFRNIIMDFQRILPVLRAMKVELAGGDGFGYPEISFEEVTFNGSIQCGHPKRPELKIPWPDEGARGVFDLRCGRKSITGTWFGGSRVDTRMCNGECAYETFHFQRVVRKEGSENGRYLDFCKTSFYPYDLAVTAFLVIAKHHLQEKIKVKSDGEICHFEDSMLLVELMNGYGMDFLLDRERKEVMQNT